MVGAHFLPFAKAFRAPLFTPLAWDLIVVAVIGGLVTAMGATRGATTAGVIAGFLLLAFAVACATLRRRTEILRAGLELASRRGEPVVAAAWFS